METGERPQYVDPDLEYSWTLTQKGEWTRVVFEFRGEAYDCLLPVLQTLRAGALPRRGATKR